MAYATKFTFDCVWRSFEEMRKKVAEGDFSMLSEVSLFNSSDMDGEGDFCTLNEFSFKQVFFVMHAFSLTMYMENLMLITAKTD